VGASMETIMMLLELKMMLLLWLVHVHGGWGATTIGDGCTHCEWLSNLDSVLGGWQLWFWSEGLKEKSCFLELLEQEEMMKASIWFFFFFFLWCLPLVKIGARFFFVSFERVNELERKVWKKYFRLFFSFVFGSPCYMWLIVVFIIQKFLSLK
jgi:hypothetical protein